MDLTNLGKRAKAASRELLAAPTALKNSALQAISQALINNSQKVIYANREDIKTAREMGIKEAMIDRLFLDEGRVRDIANAVLQVKESIDPVGEIKQGYVMPSGLQIQQVTVPLGVIGIIYESRPNVTVDAAVLCLKSGNATILRGGKEAFNSNKALCKIMRDAIKSVGLSEDCVQMVSDTSRESSTALMRLNDYLDVLIPRGGAGLIKAVVENATVPVIETGTGNCHIYIDETADVKMAVDIIFNAKTSRVSVCNACESLLVHKSLAQKVLPEAYKMLKTKNVEIRGCKITKDILGDDVVLATPQDYSEEFLDYILAVKVVENIHEAIDHISQHSSGHSECIVTKDLQSANLFTSRVDSAAVYVNASTRFTDGGEFGFGAEIGISTQKLHARGPMGLSQLTSIKYIINGNGQIR